MQKLHNKKDSAVSSHSTSRYVVGGSSWGNSTESHVQQPSMSENLSLNMSVLPQRFHNARQLSFQFKDQGSSSTQSTGQSYPEVGGAGDSHLYGQTLISASSGKGTHGRLVGGHASLSSAMGNQGYDFPTSQVDYGNSLAQIPLPYAEPYFGGLVTAAYPPQAMIRHPHMMTMLPARVPLPLDITQNEPIYVNAKQHRAILRRRENRAKLEAQNKLIKVRKPYMHESRHLHAMKRARGNGGRFLNTKKLQESKRSPTTSRGPENMSRSPQLHLFAANISNSEPHQLENDKDAAAVAASTTSCSDVTSASNSDEMFQQPNFRFVSAGHPSHVPGSMAGHDGDMHSGGGNHLHHDLSSVETSNLV